MHQIGSFICNQHNSHNDNCSHCVAPVVYSSTPCATLLACWSRSSFNSSSSMEWLTGSACWYAQTTTPLGSLLQLKGRKGWIPIEFNNPTGVQPLNHNVYTTDRDNRRQSHHIWYIVRNQTMDSSFTLAVLHLIMLVAYYVAVHGNGRMQVRSWYSQYRASFPGPAQLPYCKRRKSGRGLGTRLVNSCNSLATKRKGETSADANDSTLIWCGYIADGGNCCISLFTTDGWPFCQITWNGCRWLFKMPSEIARDLKTPAGAENMVVTIKSMVVHAETYVAEVYVGL